MRWSNRYWAEKRLQFLLNRLTGGRVIIQEQHRYGFSDVADIVTVLPRPRVVLDVGANVGQSATRFRAAFPDARIVSFEPVERLFAHLQEKTAALSIESHQVALGSESGVAEIFITKSPFANSLAKPQQADEVVTTEKVQVVTLDDFAAEFLVDDGIDLLKIDAEGFDLEVLRGAQQLLSSGRILFVLVETGFHPGDDRHPLFDEIRDFLAPYDFRLSGIYDQTHEWAGEHSMQFANVMFVRRSGVV